MELSLFSWVKAGDEFLHILQEKPKAPDLPLNPLTLTTTTNTDIEEVQEKDKMVTEVIMAIRYVIALQKEHIPIVQGFGYNIPGIQRCVHHQI